MNYDMKLKDGPFDDVANGSKTIEIRLNDEKRQQLKVGDIITFHRINNLEDTVQVKITKLQTYNKREELILDNPISIYGSRYLGWNHQQLVDKGSVYSKEQEEKYDYLAIYIKKFNHF